jgi:antitoxin (DNA-binding transcriptional repressor) of toxin-antitoxin stability system
VYALGIVAMQTTKVGIREFRENLASYLESKTPVAITRHGMTIGVYVPTKPRPSEADLKAFRAASEKMQAVIAAADVNEAELLEDFRHLRRERRARKS